MSAPSLLAAAPACCEDEAWKPIPSWPHEASTCGRVRSVDRPGGDGIWRLGAILPQHPDARPGKGYLYATLLDGRRRRKAHVAVLVLEAHRELRPGPGWEASHLYGIRTDNHLDGLAWETRAQNLARIGLHAAERAVTDTCPVTGELSQAAGHRGVRASASLSQASVTSARNAGTGSPPPFRSFPSHLTSVQPVLRTLRTSFRSLRSREAA